MSGNGSGQDPWGRRPQNDPTDLAALFKRLFKKYASNSGGSTGGSGFNRQIAMLIAGAVIIIWALSGIFLVSPQQQAVILRFGKYVNTVGEGPHWIPRGIETYKKVNVTQQNTFNYQAEMLTKDENIVSVAVAVQYRIDNPEAYLFNVTNPNLTIQQAASSALRQTVGGMNLDAVITTGRQTLSDSVKEQLVQTLKIYNPGLYVADITLQEAVPPKQVTHAFDDAIKAREDEVTYENQAQAYARKVESEAQGTISRMQQEADAYKQQVVLQAKGATARYLALLSPYHKAPFVTSERLYLDAMSSVLNKTSNVFLDNNGGNGASVFYLPLDQMFKQRAAQANAMTDTSTSAVPSAPSQAVSANKSASSFSHPRYPFMTQGGQS
ncbi:MAG: FtsH protease activity modulator HflK [Legionellales bacterium]|nr:FtsH protease activity modulator HflK [Legionellales bacterium]